MALSADAPLKSVTPMAALTNLHPAAASTTVYQGALVGETSGNARGLTAGDKFLGHCLEQCDNSAGSAGDLKVKVRSGLYIAEVAVTGASAITDVSKPVYASDDGTYTLTKGGANTLVGRVLQWQTSTTCQVLFVTHKIGAMTENEIELGDGEALEFGDADDITMQWDGTSFKVAQATADSLIELGVDGAGVDFKLFGDTAGCYCLWDQSADTWLRDGGTNFAKAVASGDGGMTVSANGMTADPETDAEAGYVTIDIGGTGYQIPIYAA